MVASQVGYLNILQDRVFALVILQAKAVRIIIMKFGLPWLKVYKFSLGGKSGLGKSSMWDLKSGTKMARWVFYYSCAVVTKDSPFV